MSEVILKIENLSKQYRLGLVGTGTISHDLNRWWHRVRGKEDPYLKIGEVNDRSSKGTSDYVWALQDINFDVKRGEVLGIIGKNGAGKSTLLKILSKVTSPTTGTIKTRGRIASLLEVGTGFHGEMTGRENIYLNGAILGMTKNEISAKIDEIVAFSGCERYIDTPVKRYSSGMTVRLAFSVAAFLEPDILVIDEVLAVGDAEFQKKAIGKMQDISKGEGRTVLFVSHNMAAVKSLCTRAIVLENGQVAFEGGTDEAVDFYLVTNTADFKINDIVKREGLGKIKVVDLKVLNSKNENISIDSLICNEAYIFSITLKNFSNYKAKVDIGASVYSKNGALLFGTSSRFFLKKIDIDSGETKNVNLSLPSLAFTHGIYIFNIACSSEDGLEDFIKDSISFKVEKAPLYKNNILDYPSEMVLIKHDWFE